MTTAAMGLFISMGQDNANRWNNPYKGGDRPRPFDWLLDSGF